MTIIASIITGRMTFPQKIDYLYRVKPYFWSGNKNLHGIMTNLVLQKIEEEIPRWILVPITKNRITFSNVNFDSSKLASIIIEERMNWTNEFELPRNDEN